MQKLHIQSHSYEGELERTDALGKVLGETKYTTDMAQDALYLRTVRSPHPHAIVTAIDISQAMKVTGVVRVLTAKDVTGSNDIGFFIQDQPLFCDRKVRFVGDAVAMVVADSPESAELGVEAVRVNYQTLPGVFNPEEALREDAPKIHEKGNVLDRYFVRKGN
ncbi:MAG TPA: hypothetical protein VJZ75_06840, partial [Candidatus Bathyarchaeia archaeon]|nr:hypothetical protein [Candidatus Bathyarchaeia archaeon]